MSLFCSNFLDERQNTENKKWMSVMNQACPRQPNVVDCVFYSSIFAWKACYSNDLLFENMTKSFKDNNLT